MKNIKNDDGFFLLEAAISLFILIVLFTLIVGVFISVDTKMENAKTEEIVYYRLLNSSEIIKSCDSMEAIVSSDFFNGYELTVNNDSYILEKEIDDKINDIQYTHILTFVEEEKIEYELHNKIVVNVNTDESSRETRNSTITLIAVNNSAVKDSTEIMNVNFLHYFNDEKEVE